MIETIEIELTDEQLSNVSGGTACHTRHESRWDEERREREEREEEEGRRRHRHHGHWNHWHRWECDN